MGILFMFVLVCLLLYAILVSHGVYFLLKWGLVQMLGLAISQKLLWGTINLVLWALASRFIYFLMLDAKGGTPNIEGVWKFFMLLNAILFAVVFLVGYKSK
ncbi:MAG: hypothetical protein IPL27_06780 [Lewinellaceae bacterium]|nr:hypothetical protein [Lewinellaceae bacterium]